ncbi:MAG: glycosyltransferase [Methylococcaceae bacterium]|nr:glycosyltransferase [Methylococcaceae bacterium]
MRIVFIITGLHTGGAEMMLLKVLTHLDRQRFQPLVISLTSLGALGANIAALNIPVQALQLQGKLSDLAALIRLVRLIKAFRPQLVHTWMYHADLLGGLAARLAGVKAIAWCIRNSTLDAHSTKRSTRLVVRVCAALSHRIPTRIISCSEQARRIHTDIGYAADKMTVIPNGFDLSRFQPDPAAYASVRKELGLPEDALIVGLIGRYDPQKNHSGFLAAASKIQAEFSHVHFVLAGKGVDHTNTALIHAATTAGIAANCHWLGLRTDMPRLMAALDVLASASLYGEAFPNVLGEAMACGVPCAVTDVGDSAYIVGSTGQVAPAGDTAALAAAITAILALSADDRHALGQQARQRVAEHFEIAAVVRQYEDVYKQLGAS